MYLIPKNVGGRFEFMEGFGIRELFYCVIGAAIGLGIYFILSFITHSMYRTLPVPFFAVATFFIVRVDPRLGKSMLNNFLDQRAFISKPRRYYYVQGEGRYKK